MAYSGSKCSKKYSFYSWSIHFQSSISPLSLMIELRLSLLTYRNSYFVYSKNVFSMTLNFSIKVKWHMCLALPHFRQNGQHGCLQISSKLLEWRTASHRDPRKEYV